MKIYFSKANLKLVKYIAKEKIMTCPKSTIDLISRLKMSNELNKDELLMLIKATCEMADIYYKYGNPFTSIRYSDINKKLNMEYDKYAT